MKTPKKNILMALIIIPVFLLLILFNGNQKYDGSGFVNDEAFQVHMKASDVILTPEEIDSEYCQRCSGENSGVKDNIHYQSATWGASGLWKSPSITKSKNKETILAER